MAVQMRGVSVEIDGVVSPPASLGVDVLAELQDVQVARLGGEASDLLEAVAEREI